MWFTLDRDPGRDDGVEQLLPQVRAIVDFIDGLHRCFAADGIDGIGGALQLHRRLKAAVDGLTGAELAHMREEIGTLERRVRQLADALEDLRRLKAQLGG